MLYPFTIYGDGSWFRQVRTPEHAEAAVLKLLKEMGVRKVEVSYNGHPYAEFTQESLKQPVWGQPETFLVENIKRGVAHLEGLPPAVRGKNKRAVVGVLRDRFGADEATAVAALEDLRPYLK